MADRRRIVVTGIGALIGQGIAQGLRDGGRAWVLGLDRRMSLYGQDLCDKTVLKPRVDETSPDYLTFWADLVRRHRIEMIIPGISQDMVFLDAHRAFFADLDDLAQSCRFSDCTHDTEPGCAILAAIETGQVDADRLNRWRKLQAEDARNSRTLAEARARDKSFAKLVKSVKQDKDRYRR